MSSIDERIVQMRFDNRDFESNVSTTMSTLEKLKEKLRFDKTDDGIKNLKNSISGFDFSAITKGIDEVNSHFSVMEVAGREVIKRLTNAAIDMGEKLTKAITIQPILDGFSEYENQINSTQTIIANTGRSIEDVTKALDNLNEYADLTIYDFGNMTRSAGMFTAAIGNQPDALEKSTQALKGIGNWAAYAGADRQTFNRITYQLSQGAAAGAIRLMDWRSIETAAGMAGAKYRQAFIDTAVDMGMLEEGEVDIENFRETLKDGWLTADVFFETMAKFANDPDMTAAATQVKTFTQLIDTLKEALGTGWATSFRYIIGNFEEAKKLWTGVKEELEGIINPISEARNAMLEFWHDNGGRDALIWAFKLLWGYIKEIGETVGGVVGDTFREIFGIIDGQKLLDMTEALRGALKFLPNFPLNLLTIERSLRSLSEVIKTVANAIKRAGRFVQMIGQYTSKGQMLLRHIIETISEIIGVIAGLQTRIMNVFEDKGGLEALARGLSNIFNGVMTIISRVADTVLNFFNYVSQSDFATVVGTFLADAAKKFQEFTEALDWEAAAETAAKWVENLGNVIIKIANVIRTHAGHVWDFIKSILGIKDASETGQSTLEQLKEKFLGVLESIEKFEETVKSKLGVVKEKLLELKDTALEVFGNIKDKFNEIKQVIIDAIETIVNKFKESNIVGLFKSLFGGDEVYAAEAPTGDDVGITKSVRSRFKEFKDGVSDAVGAIDLLDRKSGESKLSVDQMDTTVSKSMTTFAKFKKHVDDGWNSIKEFKTGTSETTEELDEFEIRAIGSDEAITKLGDSTEETSGAFRLFSGFIVGIREAFADLKATLEPVGEAVGKIKTSIQNGTWYRDLKVGIGEAIQKFKEFRESSKDQDWYKTLSGLLSGLGDAFKDLGRVLDDLEKRFLSKAKDAVEKLSTKLGELKDVVVEFAKDKTVQAFTALWDGMAFVFGKIGEGISFVARKIGDFLHDVITGGQPVIDFVKSILSVWLIFQTGSLLGSIRKFVGFLRKDFLAPLKDIASELGKSIGEVGGAFTKSLGEAANSVNGAGKEIGTGLSDMFKPLGKKGLGTQIREFATAVLLLTISLVALAHTDFERLQEALVIIGTLMGLMVAFNKLMSIFNNSLTIGKKGLNLNFGSTQILQQAAAILMIAGALKLIATIDVEDLAKSVAAVLVTMVAFQKLCQSTAGLDSAAGSILALGISIRVLASAVKTLAGLDWEELTEGMLGVIFLMAALDNFMKGTSKIEGSPISIQTAAALVILAVAIGLLSGVVKEFGRMDWKQLTQGLLGVAAMMFILAEFEKTLGGLSGSPLTLGTAAAIVVLSLAIGLLSGVVKEFGAMDWEALVQGLLSVGALLLGLAKFLEMTSGLTGMSVGTAIALVIVAEAINVLSTAVAFMGGMSPQELLQGLAAVATGLILLGGVSNWLSDVSPKIIAAAVAMGIMAVALDLLIPPVVIFGALPFNVMAQGLLAITMALIAFGVAGQLLSKIGADMIFAAGGMALMAGSLTLLIIPVAIFGAMPLPQLAQGILAIAAAFIIFGGTAVLLEGLSGAMVTAAGGIASFAGAAALCGVALIAIGVGLKAICWGLREVGDFLLSLLDTILGGIPFIGDNIHEALTNARMRLRDDLPADEARQVGSDFTGGLADGAKEGLDELTDLASGAVGSVKDTMNQAANDGLTQGNNLGTSIFDGFSMSDMKNLVTGDTEAMTERMQEILGESGFDMGSGFGTDLLDGYSSVDINGIMGDKMNGMTSEMQEILENSGVNIGDTFMSSVSKGVANGAPGLYITIGDQCTFVTETALARYAEMGLITGEEYSKAIADKVETGSGEIVLSMDTALTRLEGIDIMHPMMVVGDKLIDGLRAQAPKAGQAVTQDIGSEVETALEDTKKYFTDGGEGSVDEFLMGMMDEAMGNGGAYDTATDIAEGSVDGLEDYEREFNTTGANSMYGYADGMDSAGSYVESTARNIAAQALYAMARELDINSPSKEAAKLGRFGGMGLGVGFKDSASYVKKQAANLAGNGLTAMQSAMEKLHDALNFGKEFDPTIRPVMDLQQIQNGMSTIGSMLGSQQFALAGAFGIDSYAFQGIRNVTSAADAMPRGDQSVVNALGELQGELSTLKGAMESMKFEADGREIGHVAYREVDRRLGNTVARNRREGRG